MSFDLVSQAVDESSDDRCWAHLGAVGSCISRIRPNFDPRLYGSKKLSDLLRQYPKLFVVEERCGPGIGSKPVYVRPVDPSR